MTAQPAVRDERRVPEPEENRLMLVLHDARGALIVAKKLLGLRELLQAGSAQESSVFALPRERVEVRSAVKRINRFCALEPTHH